MPKMKMLKFVHFAKKKMNNFIETIEGKRGIQSERVYKNIVFDRFLSFWMSFCCCCYCCGLFCSNCTYFITISKRSLHFIGILSIYFVNIFFVFFFFSLRILPNICFIFRLLQKNIIDDVLICGLDCDETISGKAIHNKFKIRSH